MLDGRIQALARAHDQLTRQDWSPSNLRDLIAVEVNAFLNGQTDRLVVSGDVPLLAPEAFSTMALVVHELVTNSAKYGALTDHAGKVTIDLDITGDGALLIKWRELGGPPVQAPKRRGFGSAIIDRAVPFELNGSIETRFKLAGFEADIMIPSRFVTAGVPSTQAAEIETTPAASDGSVALSGTVLVLEDNMVIALDATDILKQIGAEKVRMASSVKSALDIIEKDDISFALLDINLGNQNSLGVAQRLAELGTPFVLATGYGEVEALLSNYPDAPVVQKPFNSDSLADGARRAMRPKA